MALGKHLTETIYSHFLHSRPTTYSKKFDPIQIELEKFKIVLDL